tara:strand:- start:571 stop:2697 length:2127 start_codon:yes stop_codon:yes gene_type:complete
MPVWDNMTRDIRHMLTFHEIAHALYTPFTDWKDACDEHGSSLRVYCNIVEDARIERMIKAKFPGARRDFLDGYRKLHARDLFEIADRDIATLSIGDRINLHYKIGFVETIPFAADEQIWIDRIDAAKTFADVIEIAIDLRDAMKDETPDTGDENEQGDTGNGVETPEAGGDEDGPEGNGSMSSDEDGPEDGEEGNGGSGEGEPTDEDGDGEGTGNSDSDDESGSESGAGMDDDTDDGESADSDIVSTSGAGEGDSNITTQEAFDRNLAEETPENSTETYVYRDLPKAKMENVVVDYTDIHKRLGSMFAGWTTNNPEQVSTFMGDAGSFINGSTKTVNQMAQQFEMKKRAEVDRTTKISNTGELDMESLVNYKFTEDIFLRAEETPNGKNHGLIILVDWSGSMCECMEETIQQMVQLVLFCKKVQIPFDVYAFTQNDFNRKEYRTPDVKATSKWDQDGEVFADCFQLLNLMSSRMNTVQYKAGLKHMMMLSKIHGRNGYNLQTPNDYAFSLSGTPLDEAIACMNEIIPAFRAQNDLNIVNLAVITDGCSNGNRWGEMRLVDGEVIWGTPILRNKSNGATYGGQGTYCNMTENLLNYVRDNTGANIVGIFLEPASAKRAVYSLVNRYDDLRNIGYDACFATFKKEGFLSVEADGYDEYFILEAKKNVTQFDINDLDDGATITKIKNTFVKSAAGSKSSRLMLNRLINHLA